MKPEVITAIIAAIVAVTSAVISIYGQNRITRLTDRLTKQREAESREAQTAALMSKYRNP
jgi:sorbitol-specific phosphotransferase system component IIC